MATSFAAVVAATPRGQRRSCHACSPRGRRQSV